MINLPRIRRVTPDGIIATYAGNGINGYSGDNGPATKAAINNGGKLAIGPSGNLYLTDPSSNVIRVITSAGIISTYAGNGKGVHSGDNIPATQAALALGAGQIVCDAAVTSTSRRRASLIQEESPAGIITKRRNRTGRLQEGPRRPPIYQSASPSTEPVTSMSGIRITMSPNLPRRHSLDDRRYPAETGFSGDGGPP
jgi:hypothetical protein